MVCLRVFLLLFALSWNQICGFHTTFYRGLVPRPRNIASSLQADKLKFTFKANGRLRLFGGADGIDGSLPAESGSQLNNDGFQQAVVNGIGPISPRSQPTMNSILSPDSGKLSDKITFTSAERVAAKDLAAKGRRASKRSLARALQGESEGLDLSDPPPIEEFRRLMESLGDESVDLFLDDMLQPSDSATASKGDPARSDQRKSEARTKADNKASRASKKSKTGAVDASRAREASVLSGNAAARHRPESWADLNPDAVDRGVSMQTLKAGEEDFYVDMDEIDSMLDRMSHDLSLQGLGQEGLDALNLEDELGLLDPSGLLDGDASSVLGDLGDFKGLDLGLGEEDLFLDDEGDGAAFMVGGAGSSLLAGSLRGGSASAAPAGKGGKGRGPSSGGAAGSKRKKQAAISLLDLGSLDQDLLDGVDGGGEDMEGYDNDNEDEMSDLDTADGDGDEGQDLLVFDPDSEDPDADDEDLEDTDDDEEDIDYSTDEAGINMQMVTKKGSAGTLSTTPQGRRRASQGEDGDDSDVDVEVDDADLESGGSAGERRPRISAPTAKRASRLNRADDGAEGGEEVRSGAERLWLPNVYSGGRPKTAPVPLAQYLAAARHRDGEAIGSVDLSAGTDTVAAVGVAGASAADVTSADGVGASAAATGAVAGHSIVVEGTAQQDVDDEQDLDLDLFDDDAESDGDFSAQQQLRQRVEELIEQGKVVPEEVEHQLYAHDEPAPWRVQIVSVVTTSSANSTALEYVQKVYDHIKQGTNNDPRITYQIQCFTGEDGQNGEQPFEELEDMIQMWLESYNTYHLVDGAAMKEAWGAIMPHIMLSPRNLQAILDQVLWALAEDGLDGALLTPRLRRLRFRGGAQEMSTGFNTEHLDSEFSTVSVR